MKKFTLLFCSLLILNMLDAQEQSKTKKVVRCGTMEAIEHAKKMDPAFAAQLEQKAKDAEAAFKNHSSNATAKTSTLTGPVTIPVIVHVVDGNPYRVTEEQIDYFLDRLNKDFSGLNPDSTNGAPFYSVRGHSLIRFTRARRTPSGTLTNGIERKVGSVTIGGGPYQSIKHAAEGGLDPWDITKYYNLWVGGSDGSVLGIAPAIGVGAQTETPTSNTGIDGVCVDIEAFSNACFSIPAYNLGRTSVHEIGHNFGLYHIFSGCTAGADFGPLSPAGQTLPASLLTPADDTPGQAPGSVTQSCPTGSQTTGCTGIPNPPGKMYQNFMDYTDDACYSMFTIGQVERMHYVLENYRSGYLTTNGATPPASTPALDVAPFMLVSPGGIEFNPNTCITTNYTIPLCPASFIPKVSIINNGSSTITSITATITVNGVPTTPAPFAINLLTGRTAVLTFPAQNLVFGNNTITFTTSAPNGGTDQVTANDVLTQIITIGDVTSPLTESFESAAFPPPNWNLTQIAGTGNWAKANVGKTGSGSALFDNYDYATGTISALTTPRISFPANTSIAGLTFHYAKRTYSGENDKLEVLISTNCGSSWTSLWSRSGAALLTVTGNTQNPFVPTAAQWTSTPIQIDLSTYKTQQVLIRFQATSAFGNNLYLDDVNITSSAATANDAGVTVINSPSATICSGSVTPQVVVKNYGTSILTSIKVLSAIDPTGTAPAGYASKTFTGLSVASGTTTVLTLDPVTVATSGNHVFKAYTDLPSTFNDQLTSNDTLTKTFVTSLPTVSLPFVEGFEGFWNGAPPAPAGWANISSGQANWDRKSPGRNSQYAAFFDNYNFNIVGAIDILKSPVISNASTNVPDSIIITFDLAHKNYTGSNDRLRVLLSTDCSATFTSVYNKAGTTLATAGSSPDDYIAPVASDWRNERISLAAPYTAATSLIAQLENRNDYGNNIFVDNFNIKRLYSRDIELSKIIAPDGIICSNTFTPNLTVKNVGKNTITAFTISYTLDNGTPVNTAFTGLNLLRDSSMTINLSTNAAPLSYSQHSLAMYPSSLTTIAGTGDVNSLNDTLKTFLYYSAPVPAQIAENFEGSFIPNGWGIKNPDGSTTWSKATVGKNSSGSAYVGNYNYSILASTKDELYTPILNAAAGPDSMFLRFDLAAATLSYPGSTVVQLDTLEVLVTKDCGNSFTSLYKKWGSNLQTLGDPNAGFTGEFTPTSSLQWRTDSINITPYINGGNFQLVFRNISNSENNIYLDNVNVSSKTLAQTLKTTGLLVSPNPVKDFVTIQHYAAPTTLRAIGFYNAAGQRLMYQNYPAGSADSYISINLSRFAAGVYTIKLEYTNKTVSQRIIKL